MQYDSSQRSPLAVGLDWATRLMALAMEFTIPVLLGYGVDRYWGLGPIGVLCGAVAGFALGFLGLRAILRSAAKDLPNPGEKSAHSPR